MAMLEVNVGSGANSRDGDSLRSAFLKINANFNQLYSSQLLIVPGIIESINALPYHAVGETVITLDGSTINFMVAAVKSLITVVAIDGNTDTTPFVLTIPIGIDGQRLLIRNTSSTSPGTISTTTDLFIVSVGTTVELVFSAGKWVII